MTTHICKVVNFFIVHIHVFFLTEAMIFDAHILSCIEHFASNFLDQDLTMWKFTSFLMLYRLTATKKPYLVENSIPTSKSPESNEELAWPYILCGSSANSSTSFTDSFTLCMWVGSKYTLNRGSIFGSSPHSPSSSSVRISFGS